MTQHTMESLADICQARIDYNKTLIRHIRDLPNDQFHEFIEDYFGKSCLQGMKTLSEDIEGQKEGFIRNILGDVKVYINALSAFKSNKPQKLMNNYFELKGRYDQVRFDLKLREESTHTESESNDVYENFALKELFDGMLDAVPEVMRVFLTEYMSYKFEKPGRNKTNYGRWSGIYNANALANLVNTTYDNITLIKQYAHFIDSETDLVLLKPNPYDASLDNGIDESVLGESDITISTTDLSDILEQELGTIVESINATGPSF